MEELGKKIDKVSNQLVDLRLQIWREYTLYSWQWWMLLGVCVGMTVLFFVLIRKGQLLPCIAYYGLIYVLNKNLDDAATAMDWYDYRMQLEPIIPTMLPANLFAIPMGLSILYGRYESWKSFAIALVVAAGFISYIALPLMKRVNIYLPKAWNAHWSFLSLVLMAAIAKLAIDLVSHQHRIYLSRKKAIIRE